MKKMRVAMGRRTGMEMEKNRLKVKSVTAMVFLKPMSYTQCYGIHYWGEIDLP